MEEINKEFFSNFIHKKLKINGLITKIPDIYIANLDSISKQKLSPSLYKKNTPSK